MLRRSLLLTTLFVSLFALLLVAIGFPAQRLFASAPAQSADETVAAALTQPMTVTVQQQIPFTITLVTSEVITPGTTPTETVTQPLTQTTVITFDVEMQVVVSESGVVTTPLVIRLGSTQQPTTPFPVNSSLALARGLFGQLNVELIPLPEPTAEVTTTSELTATTDLTETTAATETTAPTTTEELTTTDAITTSTVPTASEDLTTTLPITESATPTSTVAPTETAPAASNATLTTISNIRSDTNLEATSVVTQLAQGTPISVVAQSADQTWLLLDSGYWVSVLVVDAVPPNLPIATEAQVTALREAASPIAPVAPAPEATTAPTATVEAAPPTTPIASSPTVTVDANLRAGPGTEFEILGGTITGQTISIVGRNADGSWYRLDNGGWVAARLVANPPANEEVPVVNNDGSPVTAPVEVPTPTEEPLLLPTPTPTP